MTVGLEGNIKIHGPVLSTDASSLGLGQLIILQ